MRRYVLYVVFFFFHATPTTDIYTLSLHDALPIYSRAVFFEWLDTLGLNVDLKDESWLIDATRKYLARREPKTNWNEVFDEVRAVRRSSRLTEGWERDGARLFLAPNLHSEALLIQYLVS